jgi:hypothetical protein
MRNLGYPLINVQVHPDQLYEAISQACEFYTMYAGYTREYIIFDSALYEHNKGIRLDHLFTVANTNYTSSEILQNRKIGNDPDFNINPPEQLYISLTAIPLTYFASASSLSSAVPSTGISEMQLINQSTYAELTAFSSELVNLFKATPKANFTVQCEPQNDVKSFNNMFDYDVMDYRKVIDVTDFEEGSSTGVNTLFSMESLMAQQSYYSMNLANFGFDLLSWHTVKDWIDTREKIFAIRRDIKFDNRTQYLQLYPQPKANSGRFYGVLSCYVERPLRDIIKEKFVFDYSLALVKIMWGRALTHITGVQLLGGGSFNGEVLAEGLAEKERLETFLIEGGYGTDPIMFSMY